MKKCPFCAEEIQQEAVKCRFCGEFLDDSYKTKQKTKWYYSTSAIVIGLIVIGPFALPLVWKNPKYKVTTKLIITIVVIAVTIWLCHLAGQMYQQLIKQVNTLGLHQLNHQSANTPQALPTIKSYRFYFTAPLLPLQRNVTPAKAGAGTHSTQNKFQKKRVTLNASRTGLSKKNAAKGGLKHSLALLTPLQEKIQNHRSPDKPPRPLRKKPPRTNKQDLRSKNQKFHLSGSLLQLLRYTASHNARRNNSTPPLKIKLQALYLNQTPRSKGEEVNRQKNEIRGLFTPFTLTISTGSAF